MLQISVSSSFNAAVYKLQIIKEDHTKNYGSGKKRRFCSIGTDETQRPGGQERKAEDGEWKRE